MEALKSDIPAHWGEEYDEAIKNALIEADKSVFYSKELFFKWSRALGTADEFALPAPDVHLQPR